MIKKFEIKDYRSCLNTKMTLHPHLSVLIGPNGSGKTNILNAILLLQKLVEEEDYYYSRQDERVTGQCKLKVWFEIDEKTAIFTTTVNIYTDEENSDVIVSSNQQWYLKDFTGSAKRIKIPLWLLRNIVSMHDNKIDVKSQSYPLYFYSRKIKSEYKSLSGNVIEPLVKIAKELLKIRYYSASQFTNPSKCPVSFEIEKEGKRRRGLRLQGHSKFLFDLYKKYKSYNKSSYMQFIDIIGASGIHLVDDMKFQEIQTSSIDYSVRSGGQVHKRKREKVLIIPQFFIGKNELSPNQLSEGTFKTITLLFYLITEQSKVLLIEEPEVCVHHGLLSSIIELIKTYSLEKQILVSTHSDFVLDEVKPENVFQVAISETEGTKINHIPKSMSRREMAALHEYLETEGNLGEYWRHGGLE